STCSHEPELKHCAEPVRSHFPCNEVSTQTSPGGFISAYRKFLAAPVSPGRCAAAYGCSGAGAHHLRLDCRSDRSWLHLALHGKSWGHTDPRSAVDAAHRYFDCSRGFAASRHSLVAGDDRRGGPTRIRLLDVDPCRQSDPRRPHAERKMGDRFLF